MSLFSIIVAYVSSLIIVLVTADQNAIVLKALEEMLSFKCPSADGLFANRVNCRFFYTCNNFESRVSRCPSGMYFDDAKKVCVFKTEDLKCGTLAMYTDPYNPECNPARCKLPDCYCSKDGTRIPGDLLPNETPQMVILAFSGAVNVRNGELFGHLQNEARLNPNGCPIKATFFLSHENTSYFYVQRLYGQGHEIAMQTITNRKPEDFWSKASYEEWTQEVIGMKEILYMFANVSWYDLTGMRAPFLKPGGNDMLNMLYRFGLEYDSSIAAPLSEVPLWPYTLDFHIPHKCLAENCPTRSYVGIWEFPLNTMEKNDSRKDSCVLLDQCSFPDDPEEIFQFLNHNFQRHYMSNRAPFLLNLDVNWVTDDSKVTALFFFIDYVLERHPDVWFVTIQQALDWLRHPSTSNFAQDYDAWECPTDRLPGCNVPRTCTLPFPYGNKTETRYLQLCGECPSRYPWLPNFEELDKTKRLYD